MAVNPQHPENRRRMDKAKKYLRLFMLDTPTLNRLTRKEESEDELLTFAIDMAVDDYNITAPLCGNIHIGTYPSLYLLMHGAAIQLLKTQGLLQARNELSYSAGGSSFVRSNKTNYYMQWCLNFANDYEAKKRNLKMTVNIARGWGEGVNSEYDRIGYSW